MFLKNSITICCLALWVFPFSFGTQKKQQIVIPKLHYEETLKSFSNKIELKDNLGSLNYNDQIVVKKGGNRYYYKVRDITIKDLKEVKEILLDDSSLLLYSQEEGSSFKTIVFAINTGVMLENE